MPNKLKFYTKNKKKTYTLQETIKGEETKSAHYKFIKIKDAPKGGFKPKYKSR